jgi:8-amino-7-oxononanoate synthase
MPKRKDLNQEKLLFLNSNHQKKNKMLKFQQKLIERKKMGSERSLSLFNGFTDFFSNDYLGLGTNAEFQNVKPSGSGGSRLISGNSLEAENTEKWIAEFFHAEDALIFNSGYDANLGFFSSVPQRGDFILYDDLIHASIRDGIRLSNAKSFSFKHNDIEDLKQKLDRIEGTVFVAVESLYSMDGDIAPLLEISEICQNASALLIVDEAHACGIFGEQGKGICHQNAILDHVFARIITFGKAYGTHGAAVLGSTELKNYLVNFARSFIYTTALPPYQYEHIQTQIAKSIDDKNRLKLKENIRLFRNLVSSKISLSDPNSPIQILLTPGIENAQKLAIAIQREKIAVKAIFSPTVPEGKERLRICLHAVNTNEEIKKLCELILLKSY